MSKALFGKSLTGIESKLVVDERMTIVSSGSAISAAWRLAIALRMYAGSRLCDAADIARVTDSTVWPVVWQVTDAILSEFGLPDFDVSDVARMQTISDGFAMRSDGVMTGCVGAVDGMAVMIRRPTSREALGISGVNVQAICDSEKRFLYGSHMTTGSTHDSTAWNVTEVSTDLDAGKLRHDFWLAGNAAYAAGPHMVTPWPGRHLSEEKDSFNFRHSNSRITIECAFGILQNRFGMLRRKIDTALARAKDLVFVCMAPHNLCIDAQLRDDRFDYNKHENLRCGSDELDGGPGLTDLVGICNNREAWECNGDEYNHHGRRTDIGCPKRQELTRALDEAGKVRPTYATYKS